MRAEFDIRRSQMNKEPFERSSNVDEEQESTRRPRGTINRSQAAGGKVYMSSITEDLPEDIDKNEISVVPL